ncbi:MAG TPA: glycosyltransferase family 2 protein [Thermoanaerobaculia bacterium]|nr:glycosyltransferase family 2 protein [Thermoanaerobaculia bacterium]
MLSGLAVVLGASLLGTALLVEERRRRAPTLPLPGPPPPGRCPAGAVTVVLPVRDEQANVLPCLETLLALEGEPEVRVVDDGSTDATAELVAERARGEPRLTLASAGPLPPGWCGKVHALWAGSRGVQSPWLLATDADTRHHPAALAAACSAAAGAGLDAVSLSGFQEVHGLAENLLVAPVFALLDALLGDWEAAARGGGPAVANGQFLLLRRQAWESCGGFAAVRGEAIDDVAVAATLRRGGYRTGFFRAPGLLRVRMYRGLAAVMRGWQRNLGGLLGPRPAVTAAALGFLLLPVLLLGVTLAAGSWPAAAMLWSAGASASALLRAGSLHRPAYGLLYPLDALLLAWVLARGALDHRRGRLLSWKGREMPV